jgi:dynein heavy chain
VWSFSSTVYEVHHKELENLIRDRLPNVLFPNNDMVMGYFLDNQGTDLGFKHWNELTPAFVYDKEIPYFNLLVPTVDTTRFSFFIEQLLIHKKNVYVTGSSGTGKSVVIQQLLTSIQHKRSLDSFPFIFSAQTDSKDTQLAIENKLEKIKKNLMGAKAGRTSAIFVDDINMPAVEVYGAQPPIELLRLLVDKGGVYDRRERFWKSVINTVLVCCSAPPGGGRNNITLRFTRHFNMLNFP